MRKVIYIIVICSLLLIGCNNNGVTINYEGKSESWDISYRIEGNEKSHDSYYIFKFIGSDNKPENEIKYQIDGPKEGESGKLSLDNQNEYASKMRITGGIPNMSDRDIRVKIDWNGKTETAKLKRAE
ncbi:MULTISPECIES: hypothetical protein [unclassified Clostridium]|uniref:hypothetical protein n=1 Tax=unclassified Clostridium TaxID=2614128 RepID=UPI0002986E4D|nr:MULTISPECIES: hypothetical protein [unclassified Clostridium]EKQ57210.1 MAG: hypothetical protein A370_01140 [Clostridium sp. Maddingley MBC34-26]